MFIRLAQPTRLDEAGLSLTNCIVVTLPLK